MIKSVSITINYDFKEKSKFYYKSLLPEFSKGFPKIKNANIDLKKNCLKITLFSNNLSKIRAIYNSINRWLISIEDINNKLEEI